MAETKFKFADGRTKLPFNIPGQTSFKNEAVKIRKAVQARGKENWVEEVIKKLGQPYWEVKDGKNVKGGPAVKDPKDGVAYHIKAVGKDKKGEPTIGRTQKAGHQQRKVKSGKRRTQLQKETTDPDTWRNTETFINKNRKRGRSLDHILTNVRLAEGARETARREGISIEEANKRAKQRYKKAGQGYGHEIENLQDLSSQHNQLKEKHERALDSLYKLMDEEPPKSDVKKHKAWERKVKAAKNKINSIEKEAKKFENNNNGENDDNGKKVKIKNGDKKPPKNGGKTNDTVKISNGKKNGVNGKDLAIQAAKNLPFALSIPATSTNAYMTIRNAIRDPSRRNIALAGLGGVEAVADIAGLIPGAQIPAEAISQAAGKVQSGIHTADMLKSAYLKKQLMGKKPKLDPKALLQSKRLQRVGI